MNEYSLSFRQQGCRIKADQELEIETRIPMSNMFVIWWCLFVLGRTEISPSSDEQMPTTDTTQDMGDPCLLHKLGRRFNATAPFYFSVLIGEGFFLYLLLSLVFFHLLLF